MLFDLWRCFDSFPLFFCGDEFFLLHKFYWEVKKNKMEVFFFYETLFFKVCWTAEMSLSSSYNFYKSQEINCKFFARRNSERDQKLCENMTWKLKLNEKVTLKRIRSAFVNFLRLTRRTTSHPAQYKNFFSTENFPAIFLFYLNEVRSTFHRLRTEQKSFQIKVFNFLLRSGKLFESLMMQQDKKNQ